jgi:hypothetical protein
LVVCFVEEVLEVVLPVTFIEDVAVDVLWVTVVCVEAFFVVTVLVFANAGAARIVVAPNTVTAPTRIVDLTPLNISLTPFNWCLLRMKV